MPALIRKNGDSYWFITNNDGPWQVYSSVTEANGHYSSEWGIVNIATGAHKRIGGVSKPGSRSKVNNYDKACAKAAALNAEERREAIKKAGAYNALGYNRQGVRENIIDTLNFCTTYPGATCYNEGMPGLVRRIEAINKQIDELVRELHKIDEQDYLYCGIISAWSLQLNKGEDIDLRKS